jgi:hypothetical protein
MTNAAAQKPAAKATTPPPAKPATSGWTPIPAAPKVPNFWQGHGYTLVYASPGWAVYAGTHSDKTTLGEKLSHGKTAAIAKAWAEEHAAPADKLAAAKRTPRKAKPAAAKTTDDTAADDSATDEPS